MYQLESDIAYKTAINPNCEGEIFKMISEEAHMDRPRVNTFLNNDIYLLSQQFKHFLIHKNQEYLLKRGTP